MQRTTKIITGIIIAIIIVGGVWYLVNQKPKEEEVIKIGVLTPLTGEATQWGIPPKEGIELAFEEQGNTINNKRIEVIYEDSQCNPSVGVSAVQKLINIDKVDAIIGAVCSSVTLAISPIVEEAGIILISPASTNPRITDAGDYIFRVVPSDALRGEVFAEYIKNDVGLNKVAILYINNEGGVGNKDSFKNKFEVLKGIVTSIESYEQGTKDVKTQLLKIKESNPEAIVVVSYPSDTIVIMKQIKELGISLPLYFQTEAPDDPSVISGAGEAANNVVYILPAESSSNIVSEFKKKFEEKSGKDPALYAAEGYDAFNLILRAIKNCGGNFTHICMKDQLYKINNYPGASGIITFNDKGDVIKPMAIKKIVNGEKTTIKVK